jgi:hypothetical protein
MSTALCQKANNIVQGVLTPTYTLHNIKHTGRGDLNYSTVLESQPQQEEVKENQRGTQKSEV